MLYMYCHPIASWSESDNSNWVPCHRFEYAFGSSFLRNNLTILEAIKLTAQSALPSIKFGNRKPGSVQPLSFDMTEKHMKDCDKDKDTAPNLTVKRTFTARNIGELTVYVHSFRINDEECEGYGFRVIDCEPFVLPPNGTKKIDIAFTPDLTLTRVFRTLILETSLNMPVNYTLYTTIPTGYLDMCTRAIKGPGWELPLSFLTGNTMSFVFFICLCLAVIDAKRTRKMAMSSFGLPSTSIVQTVLDLRLVGQQVREEIQSPKIEQTMNEDKYVSLSDKPLQTKEETTDKTNYQKQPTLVFATGKTKKKLKKRRIKEHKDETSDEITEKNANSDKTSSEPCENVKEKSVERLEIEPEHNLRRRRENKKSYTSIRKRTRTTETRVYDEESLSVTSDSSSNCEDPGKQSKTCSRLCFQSKAEKNETSDDDIEECNDRYQGDKNTPPSRELTSTRKLKKCSLKQSDNLKKETNLPTNPTTHSLKQVKNAKVRERCIKERKERGRYPNKSSEKIKHVEKLKQNETNTVDKNRSGSSFNLPGLPMASWTDGRAKLGYVVSQTESSKVSPTPSSSVFSSSKITHNKHKPTVFVEPYKQTFTDLGPIGSRRAEQSREYNLDDNVDHRPVRPTTRSLETSNETDGNNTRILGELMSQRQSNADKIANEGRMLGEAQRMEVPKNLDFEELYGWQNLEYGRLLDEAIQERQMKSISSCDNRWPAENIGQMQDPNGASNTVLSDTNNIRSNIAEEVERNWNHHCYSSSLMAPESSKSALEDLWKQNLLDSSAYWTNASPISKDNPLTNDYSFNGSSTTTNPSSGYLWGSSSVWQPWTPYTASAPPRSPPGFDNFQQGNRNEENQLEDNIDPLDIPHSWSQKQSSPWDYPQEQ
ncbi:unnamed protein product [Callosobruchus maculatus]|uniref:TMEM131L fifth Ig-like domain-containing protein n=1 Tax=Callosobruchus maculatus TaxID=64391 RepID=A0A653CSJ3_CALMS|nr:unnamed protein product [Callosobruchus maculatus]